MFRPVLNRERYGSVMRSCPHPARLTLAPLRFYAANNGAPCTRRPVLERGWSGNRGRSILLGIKIFVCNMVGARSDIGAW
jgi:hypothetical protein